MGVNSENEPLSGTGPARRLFERSLQTKLQKWKFFLSDMVMPKHGKEEKRDFRFLQK